MALNGYRTAEDRRSRLVKVCDGFVTTVRHANCPQVYDVFRNGKLLGEVRKFRSWYAWPAAGLGVNGRVGGEEPHGTMRDAIDELVRTAG